MIKINLKNYNIFTILSILLLLAGIIFYLFWGSRYGVWYDMGIYSITIFLVLVGLIGFLITVIETTDKKI
jgi:hypothetical protein